MSAKTKERARLKRLKEKRNKKSATIALYESFKNSGKNSKRKKLKDSRAKTVKSVRHTVAYCGNLACKRCFPNLYAISMSKPYSCLYVKNFQ